MNLVGTTSSNLHNTATHAAGNQAACERSSDMQNLNSSVFDQTTGHMVSTYKNVRLSVLVPPIRDLDQRTLRASSCIHNALASERKNS